MPTRNLKDRIESYESESTGKCDCGELVNKVIGSSCSGHKNKQRFYYPGDNSAVNIFRCKNCKKVISDTWIEYKSDTNELAEAVKKNKTETIEDEFCQEIECEKNEHGNYVYHSTNQVSHISLPDILREYKNYLLDRKIVKYM